MLIVTGCLSRFKCVDPLSIGLAAGSAGASLIGGIFGNVTNKTIAREQMRQQQKQFETQMDYAQAAEQRQYEYADKSWQRETEYNSPIAQRERFERAGLNPSMMMEGQNAAIGSMQSVSGAPSPPSGFPAPGYTYQDPIGPAVDTYLQSRLLNSQVDKTQEEANQVQIDNRTRAVENIGRLFEARERIGLLREQRRKEGKEIDYLDKQIDFLDNEIEYQSRTLDSRVNEQGHRSFLLDQEGRKLAIDNFFADIEHTLNISLSRAQLKRIKSQIELDVSQANLNDSEAKKLSADYAKTILEAAGFVPGTDQWNQKERQIEGAFLNATRLNLPFGISIPGAGLPDSIRNRSKGSFVNGRLW